jgi:hypothetical protein
MSNASRCLSRAVRYQKLAEHAEDPEMRRAFRALAAIWQDMASVAEDFDLRSDPSSKERIYALIDAVAEEQRRVA